MKPLSFKSSKHEISEDSRDSACIERAECARQERVSEGLRSLFSANCKRACTLLMLAAGGAWASILVQGYEFGMSNNAFHIPYVLDLPKLDQFADDAFYQSLKYYVSGVWPLLREIVNESNIEQVFFVAHAFARLLTFASFLTFLSALGIKDARLLFIATILWSSTPMFFGLSPVGHHDLFVIYFTHTALATPFTVFSMIALAKGWNKGSFALAGIVFNVNAFAGIWDTLALSYAFLAVKGQENGKRTTAALKDLFGSLSVNFLVAMPSLVWIVQALANTRSSFSFDYSQYLRDYYPYHFFIDSSNQWNIFSILCFVFTVFFMIHGYRKSNIRNKKLKNELYFTSFYKIIFFAFLGGVFFPYIFPFPLIFNLQLLRTDYILYIIGCLYLMVLILKEIKHGYSFKEISRYHIILLISLSSAQGYIVFSAFFLYYFRHSVFIRNFFGILSFVLGFIVFFHKDCFGEQIQYFLSNEFPFCSVFAIVSLFLAITENIDHPRAPLPWIWLGTAVTSVLLTCPRASVGHWWSPLTIILLEAAGIFAYEKLKEFGLKGFLDDIPFSTIVLFCATFPALWMGPLMFERATRLDSVQSCWRDVQDWVRRSRTEGVFLIPLEPKGDPKMKIKDFQIAARAPVWVNWKQGAAVLWQPEFYHQWSRRYNEVQKLQTPEDFYFYAINNNINYFIVKSKKEIRFEKAQKMYRNQHFIVFSLLNEKIEKRDRRD